MARSPSALPHSTVSVQQHKSCSMGNNKVKSEGQLQGKGAKGKKDLHPKSRKVLQTARVGLRTKRINETKKERTRVEEDRIQRLLWFVKAMDADRASLSVDEVHGICETFLSRLDEELEQERGERRAGRPKSKRQEELEAAKEREALEYAKAGLGMSPQQSFPKYRAHIDLLFCLQCCQI